MFIIFLKSCEFKALHWEVGLHCKKINKHMSFNDIMLEGGAISVSRHVNLCRIRSDFMNVCAMFKICYIIVFSFICVVWFYEHVKDSSTCKPNIVDFMKCIEFWYDSWLFKIVDIVKCIDFFTIREMPCITKLLFLFLVVVKWSCLC